MLDTLIFVCYIDLWFFRWNTSYFGSTSDFSWFHPLGLPELFSSGPRRSHWVQTTNFWRPGRPRKYGKWREPGIYPLDQSLPCCFLPHPMTPRSVASLHYVRSLVDQSIRERTRNDETDSSPRQTYPTLPSSPDLSPIRELESTGRFERHLPHSGITNPPLTASWSAAFKQGLNFQFFHI